MSGITPKPTSFGIRIWSQQKKKGRMYPVKDQHMRPLEEIPVALLRL